MDVAVILIIIFIVIFSAVVIIPSIIEIGKHVRKLKTKGIKPISIESVSSVLQSTDKNSIKERRLRNL